MTSSEEKITFHQPMLGSPGESECLACMPSKPDVNNKTTLAPVNHTKPQEQLSFMGKLTISVADDPHRTQNKVYVDNANANADMYVHTERPPTQIAPTPTISPSHEKNIRQFTKQDQHAKLGDPKARVRFGTRRKTRRDETHTRRKQPHSRDRIGPGIPFSSPL